MSDKWSQSNNNFYRLCGSCCWWATVGWAGFIGHGGNNRSGRSSHYLIKEDMMTKLNYSVIPAERSDEVAELLLNSFFREEPLGLALGLPVSQVSRWLPAYIASAVKQNVSFMSVDPETDKIVGISVNVIKCKSDTNCVTMMDYLDPVSEPTMVQIAKFLGHLSQDAEVPNKADRILSILFLNVESHYGGRGIAQELTRKSEEHALSLGINTFQVDTTSEFSYKVYKKLGYETLKEIKFAEYEDENGVKILEKAEMGVHQHARVLYKVTPADEPQE